MSESPDHHTPEGVNGTDEEGAGLRGLWGWLRGNRRHRELSTQDAGERLVSEVPNLDDSERVLLLNVFNLRSRTAEDVMVPRADIVAVEADITFEALLARIKAENHSRLPVYRDSLDDIMGMIHIKDVFSTEGWHQPFDLQSLLRPVLFVAPSMRVADLLREMRQKRIHMALVVDEFGGMDGLITIEDLVEQIVGDIDDEHDEEEAPEIIDLGDGLLDADARALVEDVEALMGPFLTDEERETIDTLGGLVFALAGKVPEKDERVDHPSGVNFRVSLAEARRVLRVYIWRDSPSDGTAHED